MQPTAVFLDETPVYKDFLILIMKRTIGNENDYRGRAQNFAVPGGLEKSITLDSDVRHSINEVVQELMGYIDKYRNVN